MRCRWSACRRSSASRAGRHQSRNSPGAIRDYDWTRMSYRGLSPVSRQPRTPEQAERWISATSAGMTARRGGDRGVSTQRSLYRARQLDSALVDADLARGGDDRGPGVVGQRNAFGQALLACALLRLPGRQHLAARLDGLGALEVADIAIDVLGEEPLRVDH